MVTAQKKLKDLQNILKKLDGAVLAYSGGVDSTFLAAVARAVLGDRLLAVTAHWEVLPEVERQEAQELARQLGLRYQTMPVAGLQNERIVANAADRCYHCKADLLRGLWDLARRHGFSHVLVGDNYDDQFDHRPGMRAVREWGAGSPLLEAGLTKGEIRQLSRSMHLPTWDKPALACLASRFPYGERITAAKLAMVEQAEEVLRSLGVKQLRVRHHGDLARLEVGRPYFHQVLAAADVIINQLRQIGYQYVVLDLQGYRTGSLNEVFVQFPLKGTRC